VVVPFAGTDDDWVAVGAAAAYARGAGAPLHLLGSTSSASRSLATVSLVTQRAFGVDADPVLVDPVPEQVVEATRDAALIVLGVPDRWQERGLGSVRGALLDSGVTTVILRGGMRPSAWAPARAVTRYTWSASRAS
jgi:hypothetical protein